jgi:hypothetical protein
VTTRKERRPGADESPGPNHKQKEDEMHRSKLEAETNRVVSELEQAKSDVRDATEPWGFDGFDEAVARVSRLSRELADLAQFGAAGLGRIGGKPIEEGEVDRATTVDIAIKSITEVWEEISLPITADDYHRLREALLVAHLAVCKQERDGVIEHLKAGWIPEPGEFLLTPVEPGSPEVQS